MKRLITTLAALTIAAGSYLTGYGRGSATLAAYQEELDFLNNLTPAQLLAEIDDTAPEEINRAVLARMDPREVLGAALDAFTAEGADQDDLSAIIDALREGAQR